MLNKLVENLKPYRIVIVTGAQRSGTNISARILSVMLESKFVLENKINIDDLNCLSRYLNTTEKYVIHAPALSSVSHLFKSGDTAVVFVKRDLSEIRQSQERIGWDDTFSKYELLKYFKDSGDISEIKRDIWDSIQSKILGERAFELQYDWLKESELFIEKDKRGGFGIHQTRINMKSIFVTGCAGFVGSNLVSGILKNGYDVSGCDNLQFGHKENIPSNLGFIQKGIIECLDEANKYDILVHCATANIIYAQTHPAETFQTNAIDTMNLFREFKGKIVNISTSSVYGSASKLPTSEDDAIKLTNAYARSKYCAELFLRDRGNFTTLRLTNVYGTNQRPNHPYSGVMGRVLNTMIKGGEIEVYGDGKQTRDFVFVDDVCDAIIKAIELPSMNQEINIGTGKETSITELIAIADDVIGGHWTVKKSEPRSIDNIERRCLDNTKAKVLLGWSPKTDLHEGVKKTCDWLRSA